MIPYHRTAFGLGTLFQIDGSAAYRACFSGFLSVGFFALVRAFWHSDNKDDNSDEIQHPYAVGVLITALTFLLVFRAQAAYSRYWDACSAVHQMMSKWMDGTCHIAIYHLQCAHYNDIKPPSFFEYPDLDAHFLSRAREDRQCTTMSSETYLDSDRIFQRATTKSIESVDSKRTVQPSSAMKRSSMLKQVKNKNNGTRDMDMTNSVHNTPVPLVGEPRWDGNWGALFNDGKATYFDPKNPFQRSIPTGGFASVQGGRAAPLFLQELAHLSSLMCGVAMATLRNDIEGAESPLDIYKPGADWPPVNPLHNTSTLEWTNWSRFMNFLGMGRSAEVRTQYNASRPMPVIGGVSEGEIRFLQMAYGPSAKTQLCWQWLSEFVIREHLAGSTGGVGPPIVSRTFQFLSDGMVHYNHARKIMFIPFPFPHAQLSAIYILVAIPAVSFLMDQYTEDAWVGALLTFLTVTALSGIHEVARELENPFRNIPNEIPLVTLQAQYNEALITMYAGYHPDHFWRDTAEYYCNPHEQRQRPPSTIIAAEDAVRNPMESLSTADTPLRATEKFSDEPSPITPLVEKSVMMPDSTSPPNAKYKSNNDCADVQDQPVPSDSLDAQIQLLVNKIEEQGRELEALRANINGKSAQNRDARDGDEKKVQN